MSSRSKKHRGLWAIVLVLVVILLAITCPSRDDHRQAVSAAFHEYVNHEMAADAIRWSTSSSIMCCRPRTTWCAVWGPSLRRTGRKSACRLVFWGMCLHSTTMISPNL